MDDADLQRALALSRLDLDAAQLSQPSESSSVAAPASASASASFAFSASASSGECPKCHLSDIPSTPGGSLFVFDCRLHHECCHACAYDYTKGRLSEWQLPLCPFGCSDNVLSAAKVQQLVGTEAETMETFQVLSLSLIEPGPAAGDAVTPGGIQSSTGTPATPPGSTSGGGAKADAPPGAAGDRPGGDSLAAGGEEFDDECMGCGRDDLLVRDVFYYGCKKEHYMCKDCARRRMEDDIAARNRPTCPANCGYNLSAEEISNLCGGSREQLRQLRDLLADIDLKGFLAGQVASNSAIACPEPGCPGFMENLRPSVRSRLVCPECRHAVCNHCKGPYHIKLCCAEVGPTTDRWLQWGMSDRAKYWKMYKDLEVQQSKFAAEHRHARQRADELKMDEEWKMQHCKLCPHCGKVVNKQDGCNQMVCGTDAADKGGGNKQDGCGKTFNWGTAPAYEVGADEKFLPPSFQECVQRVCTAASNTPLLEGGMQRFWTVLFALPVAHHNLDRIPARRPVRRRTLCVTRGEFESCAVANGKANAQIADGHRQGRRT
eukprot:INCI3707.1.p1 GENE.INCI3707.1~~INCI3707.1.p1  ORF type:complete len:547 (+),score=78.44 INCI3707.1:220-1860(+)